MNKLKRRMKARKEFTSFIIRYGDELYKVYEVAVKVFN